MNTEFINYCIKSVRRRWKSLLRAALSIFLVLNNRIHQYGPVMQLLRRSGADKRVVFNILMRDCIWQNLYCIILMPVMLLIEAIIIRKNVT